MSRKPRKSPSHPRIEAEGWSEEEPTDVIDLALERFRRTTEAAEDKLRVSREERVRTSQEVVDDMAEVRKRIDSRPPPEPESAGAAGASR